ncbi:MAG: hypothetical protein ACLUGF_07325 [Clostridium sp.]
MSSPELVPGDLVYLDTGCLVPADGRLLLTHNLSANESALTGETGSIEKLPTRCIWKIFHSATSSIWYFRAQ